MFASKMPHREPAGNAIDPVTATTKAICAGRLFLPPIQPESTWPDSTAIGTSAASDSSRA